MGVTSLAGEGRFSPETAVAQSEIRKSNMGVPISNLHFLFGGLRVVTVDFYLSEDSLALHFLLQHLEGLTDIIFADENPLVSFLFKGARQASRSNSPMSRLGPRTST
jgi:hypothetical protein